MKKIHLYQALTPPTEDTDALHVWILKTTTHPSLQLLSHCLKQPVKEKDVLFNSQGKPYLKNLPIHFNISHSADWFAMVVSWETPVGIDIEVVRPLKGVEEMRQRYFSKKEQDYVEQDALRFFQVWNRKEAYLKTLGLGLQDNLHEWNVLGNQELTTWERFNQVCIQTLSPNENYTAAIAYLVE